MIAADRIDTVWKSHSNDLIGYAVSLCGDRSLALDIVQESFVRLLKCQSSEPELLDDAIVRRWLFRVVHNLAADQFRRGSKLVSTAMLSDLARPMFNREDADFDSRVVNRITLEKILSRLSLEHRKVIEVVVIGGSSLGDASDLLGLPLGTVKSRLFYALKSARSFLAEVALDAR